MEPIADETPKTASPDSTATQDEGRTLHERNQKVIALLREWRARPDDLGDEWWEDFRRELAQNSVRFREPSV